MRRLVILLCLVAGDASAKDFTASVQSGRSKEMHVYRSWTTDCVSRLGVVKVLSKPEHGRITPTAVTSRIGTSRTEPETTAHCVGRPTNGFRVDYVSNSGFHGTDQFQIQFTYGRFTDIDNYTVNVH